MDFTIRPMIPEDTELFLSVMKDPETGESYFSREYLESTFCAADQVIFLAFENDLPVGLASCRACDLRDDAKKNATHLYQVFVKPEKEGNGIGRALMRAYEDWSAQQQRPEATLFVHTKNKRAVDMYLRGGYAGYFNDLSVIISPAAAAADTPDISRAVKADYRAYAKLFNDGRNHTLGMAVLSRAEFEAAIGENDNMIFVARDGKRAAGFINLQSMYREDDLGVLRKTGFYLNNMVLAGDLPLARKQDILAQVRAAAIQGRPLESEMFCSIRTDDAPLLAVLEAGGFRTYGQMMRKTVRGPLQQPS